MSGKSNTCVCFSGKRGRFSSESGAELVECFCGKMCAMTDSYYELEHNMICENCVKYLSMI